MAFNARLGRFETVQMDVQHLAPNVGYGSKRSFCEFGRNVRLYEALTVKVVLIELA